MLRPSIWEPEVQTPDNGDFIAAYRAKFNRESDYHSAAGYSACQVLVAAVTQVSVIDLEGKRSERSNCRWCCPARTSSTSRAR